MTATEASAPRTPALRRRRLITLLLTLWGLHLLVALQLRPALTALGGDLLVLELVLSAVLIPAGFAVVRRPRSRWQLGLAASGLCLFGWSSILLVLTLLRLPLLLLAPASWVTPSADAVLFGTLALSGYGLLVALLPPVVRRVEIELPGLPAALDGCSIIQISDLHAGPLIGRRRVAAVVALANAQHADIVALTGDLVDGTVAALLPELQALAGLRARLGVFAVIGNHELYSGALDWIDALRGLGIELLLNSHVQLRHAGVSVVVAGVTDASTASFLPQLASDPQLALRGADPAAALTLLLAHQPVSALQARGLGVDLALHGHTHGGQWWPWNHFVRLQQPVVSGLHRFGDLLSYTSRGTGFWGPPLRHWRAEISLLVLRPAAR